MSRNGGDMAAGRAERHRPLPETQDAITDFTVPSYDYRIGGMRACFASASRCSSTDARARSLHTPAGPPASGLPP